MVILKMTYAKYPLKFCAIGLYFILIATCVPTAFAQSLNDTYPCKLFVKSVTPLDVSLWTGAALFAPEVLENIEIIYTYPIDDGLSNDFLEALTKSIINETNSILIGKEISEDQLVVEGSFSSWFDTRSAMAHSAEPGAISDTEYFKSTIGSFLQNQNSAEAWIIAGDQIQDLPIGYNDGERRIRWTWKQSWESAESTMAQFKKQGWAEEYSQIKVNPDTPSMRQGSDSQRKWTFPLQSCLDAASVE